jgi:predicted tellurium resistance membrane protein TerC
MAEYFTGAALVSFFTLALMEIVLGIDNIVFISILTSRLPREQEAKARNLGLTLALILRLGLLFSIRWIMGLKSTLFSVPVPGLAEPYAVTGQRLILLAGGLFLMGKSTHEIYEKVEGGHEQPGGGSGRTGTFKSTLFQILLLDLVFSLDSVITAVGMADQIPIMAAAMVVAVLVMLACAGAIGGFVNRHPSVKILALSFLLLIGVMLVGEALGQHISKGYIYFAMAFSMLVELLNMRFRKKQKPLHLHAKIAEAEPTTKAPG